MSHLDRIPVVKKLMDLHGAGDIAESSWEDFKGIPFSDRISYKKGVEVIKLPLHSFRSCTFMLYLSNFADTGRVLHNCKKIATCLSGGFVDEVSGVEVLAGNSLTWYSGTPHIIASTKQETIIFLQMFNPNSDE